MANEKKTYNPYCLVSFLRWEATGKILHCTDCVIDCKCKKARVDNDR